uniref:Sulfotransferase n=1 Tax=Salarias fasciatus TaxID=181472 RepID=A0A672F5K5_SALFA
LLQHNDRYRTPTGVRASARGPGALSRFQEIQKRTFCLFSSGTTWMQEIVTLVYSRGDPHLSQTVPNWTRAPWLEQYYCTAVLEASSAVPRLLTTHLPYRLLRTAIQDSKAKVIYVSRNPKDVMVSFYHFHKMANFLPDIGSFPEFLDRFLEGKLHFGSWFEHIIGWTQTAAVSNLLHVTYEEMLLDPQGAIKKISLFLQCPLAEDEINNCVKHCSFSSMKDNKMINYTLVPQEIMDHSKGSFMRKGESYSPIMILTNSDLRTDQTQISEVLCPGKNSKTLLIIT